MRYPYPFLLTFILGLLGCDEAALGVAALPSISNPEQRRSGQVRLTVSSDAYDGFRFSDSALITTRLLSAGDVSEPEVRDRDGEILFGDGQRTDLQFRAARYTALSAPGNNLCFFAGHFASIAEVDGRACASWSHERSLFLATTIVPSMAGTGLVVRTDEGAFRLWIVDSGVDDAETSNFILLDYLADPTLAASPGFDAGVSGCEQEGQFCQTCDDCCDPRQLCDHARCRR